MDKKTARDTFVKDYAKVGTIIPKPMVDGLPENKHGIINQVTDLNVPSGTSTFPTGVIVNGTFIDHPVTYTLQNQSGVMTLQSNQTLTAGRVLFADSTGLLVQDADLSFATDTLTATKISTTLIKDSGLTSGRVVFTTTGGQLTDDADMTFATDTLTVTKIIGSTSITDSGLTSTRITFAGTAGLLSDNADLTFTGGDTLNATKVNIGTGTTMTKVISTTGTLDFPSTNAQKSSDLTITLTGAAVGDVVILGLPAAPDADSCFTAWVSSSNTVTVRFNNYSAAAIDPASGTYRVAVIRF